VIDSGLFHVFDDNDRARFVDSLREVIPPDCRYHLLCFSEHVPGQFGPRRVTQDEIRASFSDGWRVDSVAPAKFHVTFVPGGVPAWRAAITRT